VSGDVHPRAHFYLPRWLSGNQQKTTRAEVKIYNIRGELVKDLYNGIACGDDEVKLTWNGRDENNKPISSGIYLYNLKTDDKVIDTKQCVLLK